MHTPVYGRVDGAVRSCAALFRGARPGPLSVSAGLSKPNDRSSDGPRVHRGAGGTPLVKPRPAPERVRKTAYAHPHGSASSRGTMFAASAAARVGPCFGSQTSRIRPSTGRRSRPEMEPTGRKGMQAPLAIHTARAGAEDGWVPIRSALPVGHTRRAERRSWADMGGRGGVRASRGGVRASRGDLAPRRGPPAPAATPPR